MDLSRRMFFFGAGATVALVAAPAIVRPASLMRIFVPEPDPEILLNMSHNAFGGIVRWIAYPGEEIVTPVSDYLEFTAIGAATKPEFRECFITRRVDKELLIPDGVTGIYRVRATGELFHEINGVSTPMSLLPTSDAEEDSIDPEDWVKTFVPDEGR